MLNARRPNYSRLKAGLENIFVDDYFPLDSVIMERNSRDFENRIIRTNHNAEALYALLQSYPRIKWVLYPKYNTTRAFYDQCRRPAGGYGHLLTLLFHQTSDAIRFLDALDVPKGPTLGTNFTLASPYTLLAHFNELEWVCAFEGFFYSKHIFLMSQSLIQLVFEQAAEYGVAKDLIRISVGIEDVGVLIDKVKRAMDTRTESLT